MQFIRRILPSGPMFVNLTPRDVMNSRALFTFSAFWTLSRGFLLYLPKETSPIRDYRYCALQVKRESIPMISCGRVSKITAGLPSKLIHTINWMSFTPSDKSFTSEDIGS